MYSQFMMHGQKNIVKLTDNAILFTAILRKRDIDINGKFWHIY